jgi:hypothetical protein
VLLAQLAGRPTLNADAGPGYRPGERRTLASFPAASGTYELGQEACKKGEQEEAPHLFRCPFSVRLVAGGKVVSQELLPYLACGVPEPIKVSRVLGADPAAQTWTTRDDRCEVQVGVRAVEMAPGVAALLVTQRNGQVPLGVSVLADAQKPLALSVVADRHDFFEAVRHAAFGQPLLLPDAENPTALHRPQGARSSGRGREREKLKRLPRGFGLLPVPPASGNALSVYRPRQILDAKLGRRRGRLARQIALDGPELHGSRRCDRQRLAVQTEGVRRGTGSIDSLQEPPSFALGGAREIDCRRIAVSQPVSVRRPHWLAGFGFPHDLVLAGREVGDGQPIAGVRVHRDRCRHRGGARRARRQSCRRQCPSRHD